MENSECAICGNTELLNRLCNDEYLCDDHYIVEHHGGRCPCHLLPSPPTVCDGTQGCGETHGVDPADMTPDERLAFVDMTPMEDLLKELDEARELLKAMWGMMTDPAPWKELKEVDRKIIKAKNLAYLYRIGMTPR